MNDTTKSSTKEDLTEYEAYQDDNEAPTPEPNEIEDETVPEDPENDAAAEEAHKLLSHHFKAVQVELPEPNLALRVLGHFAPNLADELNIWNRMTPLSWVLEHKYTKAALDKVPGIDRYAVLSKIETWGYEITYLPETLVERRNALREGFSRWMLDEFDANFDRLAIASLTYHTDGSTAAQLDGETRAQALDLIERLSEEGPEVCDNEAEYELVFADRADDVALLGTTSTEAEALFARFHERELAYNERILAARHEFVDIMPHLWS